MNILAQNKMAGVSSNAFANGDRQNCGNGITDRRTTRVHHAPGGQSSFSFGWTTPEKPKAPAFAPSPVKAAPSPIVSDTHLHSTRPMSAAPVPAVVTAAPEAPPAETSSCSTAATEKDLMKMTLKEVRTILRERNLNPGGSQGSLVERYLEAVAAGTCQPFLVENEKERDVFRTVNNYSRPEGQNTGNYMTDRNSSRVLAPPGGRSNFSFGAENCQP